MIKIRRLQRIDNRLQIADYRVLSHQRYTNGFSLLELLIASLCFTILLLGYTILFRYSVQSWTAAYMRTEASDRLTGGADVMNPDLRSVLPPYNQNTGVKLKGWEAGDDLGFTQNGVSNARDGHIQFHSATWNASEGQGGSDNGADITKLGYWIRRDSTNDSRIIRGYEAADVNMLLPSVPAALSNQDELIFRISALKIEYSTNGTTWTNTWETSSTTGLPKLIRIGIKYVSRENPSDVYFAQCILKPRSTGRDITL